MTTILTAGVAHLVFMLGGMTAGLACIGFFLLLGRALMPTVFMPARGQWLHCAMFGAALFVACCWYSVKLNISLATTLSFLGAVAILLTVLATRNLSAIQEWRADKAIEAARFIQSFAIYYFVAYAFLPSMHDGGELSLVRGGYNNDVLHYINNSAYLQRLGVQNIAGVDYVGEPYWVTPSALYFINLMAIPFAGDVMSAINPLLCAVIAIIAYVMSALAREIFGLGFRSGILLGSLVISGNFFWYVYGNGFFPQFIASAVLLIGILQTIYYFQEERQNWKNLFFLTLVLNFILLYTYPAMWVIFFLSQAMLVFFSVGLFRSDARNESTGGLVGRTIRLLFWWGGATFAAWAVIGIFDWTQFYTIVTFYIAKLSAASVGWPLDIIPLYSLLGLPGPLQPGFAMSAASYLIGICFLLVAARTYTRRLAENGMPMQKAVILMGTVTYSAYVLYFLKYGISYQQWKFAAYLPLLWSWVWIGAASRVFDKGETQSTARSSLIANSSSASAKDRKLSMASFLLWSRNVSVLKLLAAAVIVGAVALNFMQHRSTILGIPKFERRYSNLSAIDSLGGFDQLYVYMNDYSYTSLVPYFVHKKRLLLLSESYYPSQRYDPSKISPTNPLFLEGAECPRNDMTSIENVGCLYETASQLSIKFDHIYRLSTQELSPFFFTTSGFSGLENWGVWAVGNDAQIELSTSAESLNSHFEGYLNLDLRPYLPAGKRTQRVMFRLSDRASEEVDVQGEGWLSVPYRKADWAGGSLSKLRVDINLLDPIAPADVDPSTKDARKIGMGFISLSLSSDPKGKVVMMR